MIPLIPNVFVTAQQILATQIRPVQILMAFTSATVRRDTHMITKRRFVWILTNVQAIDIIVHTLKSVPIQLVRTSVHVKKDTNCLRTGFTS